MRDAPRAVSAAWRASSRARPRGHPGRGAGKSGARLEQLTIGGQRYVLKHMDRTADWTLRASGCLPGPPFVLWERGILARLPDCFNQPIVGVAAEPGPGRASQADAPCSCGTSLPGWSRPMTRRSAPASI